MNYETIHVDRIVEKKTAFNPFNTVAMTEFMGPIVPFATNITRFESGGRIYHSPHGTLMEINEGDILRVRKARFNLFGINCDLVDDEGNCYQFA